MTLTRAGPVEWDKQRTEMGLRGKGRRGFGDSELPITVLRYAAVGSRVTGRGTWDQLREDFKMKCQHGWTLMGTI